MKNIVVIGIIAALAIVGFVIGTGFGGDNSKDSAAQRGDRDRQDVADRGNRDTNPELRVRGRVMSISDTEIVIGTFARRQGGRDGGFDREQIQNMSQQEREAFRAQREAERQEQGESEITGEQVLTITEETVFTRGRGGFGRGGGRGQGQGDDNRDEQTLQREPEVIEQSTVQEGMTVNAILKENSQEAVSISVQEQE